MSTILFTESTIEEAALAWLEATGWQVAHGPDISLAVIPRIVICPTPCKRENR